MKDNCIGAYKEYVEGVGKHPLQSMTKQDNNRYAWVDTTGKLVRATQNNCFATLGTKGVASGTDLFLLQIQDEVAKKEVGWTDEGFHTYYEWLFNYSPLRDAFIHKDVSKVLKDRVVAFDTNQDSRIVICAANAVRIFWECYYEMESMRLAEKILIWYDLVKLGTHPTVAFSLCHGMIKSKAGYQVTSAPHGMGHEFLNTLDIKHLNFIEEAHALHGVSFKEYGGYDGIGVLYAKDRTKKFNLQEFIKERWGKAMNVTNPFAAPVSTSKYLQRDEFLGTLKEITTDYTAKLKEMKIV